MEEQFKKLFTPLQVGNVIIPNRIFMSNAAHRFYSGTAAPNERVLYYYEARAKGGAGLLITGPHYPSPLTTSGSSTAYQDDNVIPILKKQADTIHQYGTKVFAQLGHPGSYITGRGAGGGATWGPSPTWRRNLFAPGWQEIAHEMDVDEIKRFVRDYGSAARRVKEAGYDGVEIMSMVGLLHAQFLSSAMNIRTDEYGGSMENRMRFLLETVDSIREAVGSDFVVGVRFTADDFIDRVCWTENHGNTLDDTKEIAKKLEATGKFDYLFPCATAYGPAHVPPMNYPLAPFIYLTAAIKEVVNLPVFGNGRINDPILAEKILTDNQADMIGITRGLIADPEFAKKARENRLDEIRKCIACNEGCTGGHYPRLPLCCALNVEAGREKDFVITPADEKKSVMVIGGGAAGLETARVAALRGHKVSLYEEQDVLAPELLLAAKSPGRGGFDDAARYYTYQMSLLGVDVHLNTTITSDMVLKQDNDAVVIAIGATHSIPEIPGAESSSVNVVEMRQVLREEMEIGQNVIIADYENHLYGLDVADFLASKGKKVELFNESVFAGGMADYHTIHVAYTSVLSKGVTVTPLTAIKEIKGNKVVVYNLLTNAEREIEEVDTVVVCTDGAGNDSLYHSLKGKVKALYRVGQCVSPRRMLDSIFDGYKVGRTL
ncbi:MAG: FAD-dependent oxidoreductase [Armatimonadetes bacterium]|nr:FAD-dependent oxidoreductase [Armatimonadota bacterium]